MRLRLQLLRASAAVLASIAAFALPASALATAPFTGLTGSTSSTSVTSTTSTSTAPPITIPTTTGGGLSALDEVGIGIVAIAVFATIIYVIRRDAHIHAPRHAAREIDRERGTVAPRTERIKRSRAKAKAARRARRSKR
ncbi:MAG: hypothetical protein ABSD82_11190 [Solirubrobacteraceae bacterium]|jgi:hypothetical protein